MVCVNACRCGYGADMRRVVGRIWLRIWRYKAVPLSTPIPDRCVLIAAPHTSNWDLPIMLALAAVAGIKVTWLGKAELFKGPMGPVMRKFGGVPVNRTSAGTMVSELVEELASRDVLRLMVPVEGTRSKGDYWKSGFYRIAVQAQVPVVFAFVDRTTRTGGFATQALLTGDMAVDMDSIRQFYRGKEGLRPGRTTIPRLREEGQPNV